MTTHFENKEHYLAFRTAWANAVNDPRSKSHTEPCDEYLDSRDELGRWRKGRISKGTGKKRVPGWLTRAHHVLFNALLGRPLHSGFTPITNRNKLDNGTYFNAGLYFAVEELKWFIDFEVKRSQREVKDWFTQENKDWAIEKVEQFLAPFDGTVTVDMLLALDIQKVEPIYSLGSKGKKIRERLDQVINPITSEQLWDLYLGA